MRRRQRGITLIELLIAVTLVSLLSVGILMAMRIGLNAMERTNSRIGANRRVLGAQRISKQFVAGLMPVMAFCRPAPAAPPARMLFFQGEAESMRLVSSYSIEEAGRGAPRVAEFLVIPGAGNQGVRLIVNEHLYTGPVGTGFYCFGLQPDPVSRLMVPRFRPIEAGPRSFILADKLRSCRFWYQRPALPPAPEQWVDRWLWQEWPTAIRIELTLLEADASRIQPTGLTMPVFLTKSPYQNYADGL
ncbi:MAG: prepilin-type N-terminal cleavage/methylation domain-containing protein [Acidobacteria bacterium]|nr:prepilin-type N-terminal cleavage/methylation domain-containing protein [Acidobacteriota bacterium]